MILVLLALLGVLPVQSAPAAAAGTWVGDHQGTTWVRLELKALNNTLAGGIATGNMSLGKNGEVVEVTPVPAVLTPLTELTVNGAVVSFFRLEGDENEHFRPNVPAPISRADLPPLRQHAARAQGRRRRRAETDPASCPVATSF